MIKKILKQYGSSKGFDNDCSEVGFLGNYPSVEAVRAFDKQQLKEINGSYEEITDRLKFFFKAGAMFHNLLHIQDLQEKSTQEGYLSVREYLSKKERLNLLEDNTFEIALTRGSLALFLGQECPFKYCNVRWIDDIFIKNIKTDKLICINYGQIHLAEEHHFLQKSESDYKIIPKEFYEHFMFPRNDGFNNSRLSTLSLKYAKLEEKRERLEQIEEKRRIKEEEKELKREIKKFKRGIEEFKRGRKKLFE